MHKFFLTILILLSALLYAGKAYGIHTNEKEYVHSAYTQSSCTTVIGRNNVSTGSQLCFNSFHQSLASPNVQVAKTISSKNTSVHFGFFSNQAKHADAFSPNCTHNLYLRFIYPSHNFW